MRHTTSRTCADCGGLFQARSDAAYCSSACRQRAYRQRSTARSRPVDQLIAEVARIVTELERHGMYNEQRGMPDSKVLETVAFSDGANKAIDALRVRLRTIRECLEDEEMRRHHWAAMQAMARDDHEAVERHLAAWRAVDD